MNDAPKFTPGPWHPQHGGDGLDLGIYAEHEQAFDLATVHNGGSTAITLANAALISAAPEMYEALRKLLEHHTSHRFECSVGTVHTATCKCGLDLAAAALAKADGKVKP